MKWLGQAGAPRCLAGCTCLEVESEEDEGRIGHRAHNALQQVKSSSGGTDALAFRRSADGSGVVPASHGTGPAAHVQQTASCSGCPQVMTQA